MLALANETKSLDELGVCVISMSFLRAVMVGICFLTGAGQISGNLRHGGG